MNENLIKKLDKLTKIGTHQEKIVAQELLANHPEFSKISELAELFHISHSSVSRFIKELGYPSFKLFLYEYIGKYAIAEMTEEDDTALKLTEMAQNIAQKVKPNGEIYIICSRRAKGNAKFFRECLNRLGLPTNYYHESSKNMQGFLANAGPEDTIFIITLSGYSASAAKALMNLGKKNEKKVPEIIILSATKLKNIFDKYVFISLYDVNHKKMDIDTFAGYNYVSLQIMGLMTKALDLINQKYNFTK